MTNPPITYTTRLVNFFSSKSIKDLSIQTAHGKFGSCSYLVDGMPAAQLLVLNPTDTVKTSGLDELFEDGVLLMGSINVPLPIAGK